MRECETVQELILKGVHNWLCLIQVQDKEYRFLEFTSNSSCAWCTIGSKSTRYQVKRNKCGVLTVLAAHSFMSYDMTDKFALFTSFMYTMSSITFELPFCLFSSVVFKFLVWTISLTNNRTVKSKVILLDFFISTNLRKWWCRILYLFDWFYSLT